MAGSPSRYLEMPLDRVSVIKGTAGPSNRVVKFYAQDLPYAPKMQAFLELSGKPAILFLAWVDEVPNGLYISNSPNALQPQSPSTVTELKAELDRQRQILQRWRPDPALPHYGEVRRLLGKLPATSSKRQQAVFRKLEELGKPAVSAMIAQMDDRRPLAHQEISLINHSPDAFEGTRFYGPDLVVDAMDAILNQIVAHGGSIVNGGSERQRRSAVEAWRIYDTDQRCGPS